MINEPEVAPDPDYAAREFYTFRIELQDTIDTALNRLSILEENAAIWVKVDLALTREPDDPEFGLSSAEPEMDLPSNELECGLLIRSMISAASLVVSSSTRATR